MKYTTLELLNRINSIDNGDYICITKEFNKGIKTKVRIRHKCGYEYECILKGFLNEGKSRCPKCKEKYTHSTKKINESDFINKLNDEYSYIDGFKNMNTKCIIKHNKCNNTFKATPHMLLGSKHTGCPYCANKNRGKYAIKKNYLNDLLNNAYDGNEYKWLESYKGNNKIKHEIKHLKCNKKYEVRPNDFQQGYRCPYCKASKGEKKISMILEKLNIDFEREYSFSDCRYKSVLKFDFKINLSNNNFILLEYDGEFHDCNPYYKELLEEAKIRDQIKNDYCKKNNFTLVRVSYKEYNNLEKIIKKIINP